MLADNTCLNCSKPLLPTAYYCSNCGQSANTHRLSLHHLWHELLHFFTHADKGIFLLIKRLLTQPGVVARQYISGQRKAIFSPVNFFFLSVGLFVFVQTTLHPFQGGINLTYAKQQVATIPNEAVRAQKLAVLERSEAASNFMAKNSNIINFILTPVVAFIFFVFYKKAPFNYTEHLVTNLFMAGLIALFFVVVITPYLLLTKQTPYYYFGIGGFLVFEVIYRTVTYYQLLGNKGIKAKLIAFGVSVVTVMLWAITSSLAIRWYIKNGW